MKGCPLYWKANEDFKEILPLFQFMSILGIDENWSKTLPHKDSDLLSQDLVYSFKRSVNPKSNTENIFSFSGKASSEISGSETLASTLVRLRWMEFSL